MTSETNQKSSFSRRTAIGIVVTVIVAWLFINFLTNSPDRTTQPINAITVSVTPTLTPEPVKPEIIIASTLVADYNKNKLSADDKYKGKFVQTTAYIQNISDGMGSYYLVLSPESKYQLGQTLQCYFKDKEQLIDLANGQAVTITGTLNGMTLGIINIKDCTVIK